MFRPLAFSRVAVVALGLEAVPFANAGVERGLNSSLEAGCVESGFSANSMRVFEIGEPASGLYPDIRFDDLHLEQGFNYRADVQDAYGFITSLSISGTVFSADFASLKSATTKDSTPSEYKAVGILQSFKWSSGITDPLTFKFNVSAKNRNTIFAMLHDPSKLTSPDVTISYVIFSYDQLRAQWYLAMSGGSATKSTALQTKLAKQGKSTLLLSLPSNLQNETVKSPANWDVSLSVMPQAISQQIMYQFAPGQKVMKPWGVRV